MRPEIRTKQDAGSAAHFIGWFQLFLSACQINRPSDERRQHRDMSEDREFKGRLRYVRELDLLSNRGRRGIGPRAGAISTSRLRSRRAAGGVR
jgi:hypothetical protein